MTMTPERFQALAGAYGGDPARWPDDAIASAAAFMAREPELARGLLAEERALDAVLALSAAPAADAGLQRAILVAAPGARPVLRWWAGASLAAACLVGVLVGALLPPESALQWQGATATAQADPLDDAAELFEGESG